MKHTFPTCLAVFCMVSLAFVACRSSREGDEVVLREPGLLLRIDVQEHAFRLGEAIPVTVTLGNRTNGTVTLWREHCEGRNGISHIYFEVIPVGGGRAINTNVDLRAPIITAGGIRVVLEDGATDSLQLYLNEWYYLAPGEYTIQARFHPNTVFNSVGEDYYGPFVMLGAVVIPTPANLIALSNKIHIKVTEATVEKLIPNLVKRLHEGGVPDQEQMEILRSLAFTYEPEVLPLLHDVGDDPLRSDDVRHEAERWIPRIERFGRISAHSK